jgi:hypothetical protein
VVGLIGVCCNGLVGRPGLLRVVADQLGRTDEGGGGAVPTALPRRAILT